MFTNAHSDINILIMGKTCVGKSTLVNNLMDNNVAKVNDFETGTFNVEKRNFNIHQI